MGKLLIKINIVQYSLGKNPFISFFLVFENSPFSDCKIFISNISLERSQEIAAFLHVYTGNYELIENYWGSCSQKWAWPPWSQDLNWLYLKKESTDFFLLAIQIQDIANNWVGMIKIECGSFKSWDSKICCIATMNG